MAVRYTALQWARDVPTLLHRGRVDRLGHHLLLLLATFSKNDGSDMYASVTSLARHAHAPEQDVVDALGRLETAGLIERAHASNGAPGWSLRVDVRFDGDRVVEDRVERRRIADRERQRRRRERQQGSGHGTVDGDVTDDKIVTDTIVTQEFPVTHAQLSRDNANVTDKSAVSHGSGTVTTAGQTGSNSLMNSLTTELPYELHADADASGASEPALIHIEPQPKPAKPAAKRRHVYSPEFEAAWLAYERRGDKPSAYTEWKDAIRRADAAVILAAIPPYVASTPDLKFRKHMENWLKKDGWESAIVPAGQPPNGQHVPYRNPTDPNAYDGPL